MHTQNRLAVAGVTDLDGDALAAVNGGEFPWKRVFADGAVCIGSELGQFLAGIKAGWNS